MKIKNYRKFIRSQLLMLTLIIIISMFFSNSSYSYSNKKLTTIYVSQGDTLWSIASNLQNSSYYNGKDIRYIINDIKDINGIKNSNLSIGEKINIPVE